MTQIAPRQPARVVPSIAALLCFAAIATTTSTTAAQDRASAPAQEATVSADSRTETSQISAPAATRRAGGKAYTDTAPAPPANAAQDRRTGLTQTAGEQRSRTQGKVPPSQISQRGQGGPAMVQLSKADLDATLAQLSPAERRVLLQAIEGTDICDNPPAVAAVVTLCQNRIEARSQEFAAPVERVVSAEERLIRGDLEDQTALNVSQVIERLARTSASSDDIDNQAIASIALTGAPTAPGRPGEEEVPGAQGLSQETQALVNALINQLGGRAP